MPDWMAELTLGEIIATIGGLGLLYGIIFKLSKPIKRANAALEEFMADWNGRPERKDAAGNVIAPARPGVLSQIEVLRDQLQNSHQDTDVPNLRDDLDTKASKADVAAVVTAVETLTAKVDQHIEIAKASDERQDETGRIVDELLPKIQALLADTAD